MKAAPEEVAAAAAAGGAMMAAKALGAVPAPEVPPAEAKAVMVEAQVAMIKVAMAAVATVMVAALEVINQWVADMNKATEVVPCADPPEATAGEGAVPEEWEAVTDLHLMVPLLLAAAAVVGSVEAEVEVVEAASVDAHKGHRMRLDNDCINSYNSRVQ